MLAVGGDDHGHGVPADVAANLALDAGVAGVVGLVFGGDGVGVRRADGGRDGDAAFAEALGEVFEENLGLFRVLALENVLENVFEGIEITAGIGAGAIGVAKGGGVVFARFADPDRKLRYPDTVK